MARVLFVHGTGVREPSYTETLTRVQRELRERRPNIAVEPCYWGGQHGSALHHHGGSIPLYDTTRGQGAPTDDEQMIALWAMLYQDPLYELRTLSLRQGGGPNFIPGRQLPGDTLDRRVRALVSAAQLARPLEAAGIAGVFVAARDAVVGSAPYREALGSASEGPGPYQAAIARAVVAAAIIHAQEARETPAIAVDATQRDEIVSLLVAELGAGDRGIGAWAAKQVSGLAQRLGAMDQAGLMRERVAGRGPGRARRRGDRRGHAGGWRRPGSRCGGAGRGRCRAAAP